MDSTAEEKQAIWKEVAKQMAHEINTPLSSMKLNLQYLQRIAAREGHVSLTQMDAIGNALIQQIDNLSEIASIFGEYAQLPKPNNVVVSLNKMVQHAYVTFNDHKSIHLEIDLPKHDIQILGDENCILRTLNNLLKNAIQAIPSERLGIVRILLSMDESSKMAILKVMDNGKGIPEDERSKIFEPHFTTKKSGMGLGLAIVKNIIDSMNGDIFFHSSLDRGTVFIIELPMYEG